MGRFFDEQQDQKQQPKSSQHLTDENPRADSVHITQSEGGLFKHQVCNRSAAHGTQGLGDCVAKETLGRKFSPNQKGK